MRQNVMQMKDQFLEKIILPSSSEQKNTLPRRHGQVKGKTVNFALEKVMKAQKGGG
jgi:hypothetical protein